MVILVTVFMFLCFYALMNMSLGRGLGALITPTGGSARKQTVLSTGQTGGDRIWTIPLNEIKADPKQPRRLFKPEELQELADSIKVHGVLQPILVREKDTGGYEVIAGERRFRASQLAGISTIPAIVKKFADRERLEVALVENLQRENLNPIEEAYGYERLIKEFGLTQEQVAEKVGKSRPAVANLVRLLGLPSEVQTALIQGEINTGQARSLLTLASPTEQLAMLASMRGQKITVRELEAKVRTGAPRSVLPRDPNLAYLENELRSALGAKTTITPKAGGQGMITIQYHSTEELSDIIKKITS